MNAIEFLVLNINNRNNKKLDFDIDLKE